MLPGGARLHIEPSDSPNSRTCSLKMDTLLWALMGVVAGACIAVQAPINASLGRALEVPIAAAAMSFLAGGVVLWALAFIYSHAMATPINFAAPATWTLIAGGLLGASTYSPISR